MILSGSVPYFWVAVQLQWWPVILPEGILFIAAPAVVTGYLFTLILPEMHATARPLTRHTQGVAAGAQAPPTNNAAPHAASIVKGRFILQAASFPDIADASRLRAELALRGLGSYIEKVSISGRGAFYRVRIGPLRRTAIAHARHVLARLNLKPILLREARGN